MDPVIEKTTKKDQVLAQSSILEVSKAALDISQGGFARIKIEEQEQFVHIPEKALQLLISILKNMAEGNSITLISSSTEISTQQAAGILNVSRPHIVRLLENNVIPFKKVGTHRRIALTDLIKYEKKLKENRRKNLDFLAEQAQELNLGY